MYNFYDNYEYDSFYEGANLDIRAKLKEASKIYNKNMKDISKAVKAGKYNEARTNIETLRKSLADLREDIEKIDAGEIDSIVYGLFTSWTIHWLRTLISAVLIIPTLGFSGMIENIRSLIDDWGRPIGKIARGDMLTADDANAYKNTALSRMNYLIGTCKKLDKRITQLADTKGAKVKATAEEIKKESVMSMSVDEFVMEGVNSDLVRKYNRYKKIYKSNIKNIQKYIKEEKFDDAKKEMHKLRDTLDPIRKDIYDTYADDKSDVIESMFMPYLEEWGKLLIAMVLSIPTFGLSAWVYLVKKAIDFNKYDPKTYRQNPEDTMNSDTRNDVKRQVLANVNKLDHVLGELEKEMDKRSKEPPNKMIKESVALDFKKALYEACNHGLITMEQREELLETSRTNMYIEAANTTTRGFDTMSNEDQFKQVRRVLYERCKSGEISIDERDEMLLNARRKYF